MEPYKEVSTNTWLKVGNVNVMYKVEREVSLSFIKEIFHSIQPSVIHLNSLMSIRFSFLPLLAASFWVVFSGIVLLSPRGELSPGALKLKKYKKRLYLNFFKLLGLEHKVEWLASSDGEGKNIFSEFGKSQVILHRVDNVPNFSLWTNELNRQIPKKENQLKLIFFSRISPMKNLAFLLNQLKDSELNIDLSIYGPQEDIGYFSTCSNIALLLPKNISIKFMGALPPSEVYCTLKEFDLFVLPTLGENFGQAIWEALASSVPILISEHTPWKNLIEKEVGWDVSLDDSTEFKRALKEIYIMNEEQHQKMRSKCRDFALDYVAKSDSLNKLKKLYIN